MGITVAVPTRNGSRTVRSTLDSIRAAVLELGACNVEVLVVDNASDDAARAEVARAIQGFPCEIRLVRHRSALPYDENVNSIFELARTEFVKLLADDDLLIPAALTRLSSIINEYPDVDALQHEFIHMDSNCFEVLHKPLISPGTVHYSRGDARAIRYARGRHGQLSSLLFKRRSWSNVVSSDVLGTNYVHSQAFIRLADTGNVLILGDALVLVRDGSPNFTATNTQAFAVPLGGLEGYAASLAAVPRDIRQEFMDGQLKYVSQLGLRYLSQGGQPSATQLETVRVLMPDARLPGAVWGRLFLICARLPWMAKLAGRFRQALRTKPVWMNRHP